VLSYLDQMRNCVSDSMKVNLMHKGILTANASQRYNKSINIVNSEALYQMRCTCPFQDVDQRRQRLRQFFPILEQIMSKDILRLIRHKLPLPKYWKVHEVRLSNAYKSAMSYTFSTDYSYDILENVIDIHHLSLPEHPFFTIYENHADHKDEVSSFVQATITVYAERNSRRFAYTIPIDLLGVKVIFPENPLHSIITRFNTPLSLLTPLGMLLMVHVYNKKHKKRTDQNERLGVYLAMALEQETPSRVWSEMKRYGVELTPGMTRMVKQINEAWKLSEQVHFPRITYVTMYNVEDHFV